MAVVAVEREVGVHPDRGERAGGFAGVETEEPGEELRGSVLVGRLIFTVIGAVIGIPLIIILFVISAWCHI